MADPIRIPQVLLDAPVAPAPDERIRTAPTDPINPVKPVSAPLEVENKPGRYALATVAEVASMVPLAATSLAGLASSAWDWGLSRVSGDEPMSWTEATTDPHYRYLLGEMLKANETGDEERAQWIASKLPSRNPQAMMRGSFRAAQDFYNLGTEVANLPLDVINTMRDRDAEYTRVMGEQPYDEEIAGVVGSAFVGLPAKIVGPGAAALGSAPARALGRTLEAITPVTLPLSPGNVALNALGGAIFTDIARGFGGESSVTQLLLRDEPDLPPEVAAILASPASMDDPEPVEEMHPGKVATYVLGGAALVGAAGAAYRGKWFRPDVDDVLEAGPSLRSTGGVEAESGSLPRRVTEILHGGVTQGEDLVSAVRAERGDDIAEAYADTYAKNARNGSDAVTRYTFETGQLPDSGMKTVPIADMAAREAVLTPDQRNILRRGLISRDIQRDMQLNNYNRPVAQNMSGAELQANTRAAYSDPQVSRLMNEYGQVFDDLLEWETRQGWTSRQLATKLQAERGGHYFPNISAEDDVPLTGRERVAAWFRTGPAPDVRLPREEARGDVGVNIFDIDTLRILEGYVSKRLRKVQHNAARREFVEAMNPTGVAGKRTIRVPDAEVYGKGWDKADWIVNDDVVHFRKHGKDEFHRIGDPHLARALEFHSPTVVPVANWTRRNWQKFTTGIFAPWRAARAAFWDLHVGMMTRPPGTALGVIDEALLRATGGKINMPIFDPSAALAIPHGMGVAAYGHATRNMAKLFTQSAANGTGWVSALVRTPQGRAWADNLGKNMANRYANTTYAMMHGEGFSPTSFLADSAEFGTRVLGTDIVRRMPHNTPIKRFINNTLGEPAADVWRMYEGLMDSVHNSVRYSFASRNRAIQESRNGGRPLTAAQRKRLGRQATQLSGDMRRNVNNKYAQGAFSAIPYANVAVQSMAHLGRYAFKGPTEFALFTTTLATLAGEMYALKQMLFDMGGGDWWENELAPYQTTGTFPIPKFDVMLRYMEDPESYEFSPDDIAVMTLAPEFAPMVHALEYGLEQALMLAGAEKRIDPVHATGIGDDLKESMKNIFAVPTPPIVNAAIAMGNVNADKQQRLDMSKALGSGNIVTTASRDRLAAMHGGTKFANQFLPDNMHNLLVVLAGTGGQIIGTLAEAAAYEGGDGIEDEMDSVFDRVSKTLGQEVERRVEGATLWTGQNTRSRVTVRSTKTRDLMRLMEPVFAQYGAEIGTTVGQRSRVSDILYDEAAQNIAKRTDDPEALAMISSSYAVLTNDVMRYARQELADLDRKYSATQGNFAMAPGPKQDTLNSLVDQMNGYYKMIAQEQEEWQMMMQHEYGHLFPDGFTPESMIEYIDESATVSPKITTPSPQ